MERFQVGPDDLPAVITSKADVLCRPSSRALADAIGLSPEPLHGRRFDLAVVGAGPAGLAAAVYGASEGLRTVVLDATAPRGQKLERAQRSKIALDFRLGYRDEHSLVAEGWRSPESLA
ncbi:FAD-binding protein [Cupriavidus sp. CP313]